MDAVVRDAVVGWGRLSVVLAMVGVLLVGAAAPAAAQPANDDFDDAVPIVLPFEDTVDTTDATQAGDDPVECFGAGPTVWYRLTPAADTFVEINTFGSDYDTTLSVYTGDRGSLAEVACNDDTGEGVQSRVRFDAAAGTSYHVMVGAFDSGPGGQLQLAAFETVPAPPVELTVELDDVGRVDPSTGAAWLTGTVSCQNGDFVELFGQLEQRAGRVIISGFGFDFLPCDGQPAAFELPIEEANGRFTAGRANALVNAFACSDEECTEAFDEQPIRLRPDRGRGHNPTR